MIESEQLRCQGNEESGLVKAAVSGDRLAFDELVRLHSTRVFRLALAMLGNPQDAEDVQQEAFLQAYKKLHTFKGRSSFGTWMHAITARSCLMHRRSARYRYEELSQDVLLQASRVDLTPENIAIAAESAGRIQRVLSQMAPSDRIVVVLRYVEQLDHKEIAEVLGCSEAGSRSRLVRAKKMFRGLYGKME